MSAELLAWAQTHPVEWLEQTFVAGFWERQQDIIRSFFEQAETYVPSCHASGKSYTAAHAALAALYTHPWCKVITTATAWYQVETVLWAELRQAHARMKMRAEQSGGLYLGGSEPNLTSIEIAPGWFAVGVSTDNPVRMQGQHARGGVYIIVDEADGISTEIWEAIRANLSTGDCHLLAIGNPVDPQSYFAKMCGDATKNVIPITAFDTPNFTKFDLQMDDFVTGKWRDKVGDVKLPAPWLVTPQWVATELANEGGDIESPFILSRVRARYPNVAEDVLIQQSWIDKAWNNWRDGKCGATGHGGRSWGLDVARFGDDKTVLAERNGARYHIAQSKGQLDGEGVASMVRFAWERARIEDPNIGKPPVAVDVVGVGASAYDFLKKIVPVIAVESAGSPECTCGKSSDHKADCNKSKFYNRRAEIWWGFREELRTGVAALDPNDRELARQLTTVKYEIRKGKVLIEEKAEIKKRLGKSPDRADAVVYASASTKNSVRKYLESLR